MPMVAAALLMGPISATLVAPSSASAAGLENIGRLLQSGDVHNVVVLAGAGISVSAGIPDFRSPGTGLYDNLQQYGGLPYPEAIFELDFFRRNPQPFYRLCSELWPGQYEPTPTHHFFRLLHDQGVLTRVFTQNIDSLESTAGLPSHKIVAAHGNFDSASVWTPEEFALSPAISHMPVPINDVRAAAVDGSEEAWSSLNAKYGGLVKPDIVFFGEKLPSRFFELLRADFARCDLLLVLGTSCAWAGLELVIPCPMYDPRTIPP